MKNRDKIILVHASDQDYNFAYDVKKETLKKYVEEIWGWNEEDQKNHHEKSFKINNAYVIKLNEEKIGWLVYENRNTEIEISGIFILPEYQDKGIGTKIINYIIAKGKEKKSSIKLQVFKNNQKAVKLYKKIGFKIYDETKTHYLMKTD